MENLITQSGHIKLTAGVLDMILDDVDTEDSLHWVRLHKNEYLEQLRTKLEELQP